MAEFLARLRQRKLVQWAIAYLAGAWVLLQVLDMAAGSYGWPSLVMRLAFALAVLGFVVTMVLAWYHGERGQQKVSGIELLVLALLLAVGGGLLWRYAGSDARTAAPSTASASGPTSAIPEKSIAVLPFENLSSDKDNAYFADGMQDLILTKLADIGDLKVISRTSTMKYQSRPDNLRKVAGELGVAHILEGSVQRAGDKVLISLQLIDARTDAHLWAESFERQLKDVFSVEREVANAVATALSAKLLPSEVEGMGQAPTASQQAYDLFLRGEYGMRKFYASTNDADMKSAIAHYEQAVAIDPRFALAYAGLSRARLLLYWSGNGTVPDRSLGTGARDAASRAMQLAPGLPEALLAKANIEYRLDLDYAGALASFDAVLARRPQSVDALMGKAQALRRLGRYDEAIAAYSSAVAIDPRESAPLTDRAITRFLAGDLDAAESDLRRSLSINPEDDYAAQYLGELLLFRDGDPAKALAVLQGDSLPTTSVRARALTMQHRFDAALKALDQGERVGSDAQSYAITRAQVLASMGRTQEARQLLSPHMPEFRNTIAALPVNSGAGQRARIELAMAEAILGNARQAVALAEESVRVLPPEKDLANGAAGLGLAARVYAMLGRTDLLLPMLARIHALKGTDMVTSAAILRLDPVFDKVRDDPGFQAEIDRFAARQARLAGRSDAP
jgi:TolB-like protein/Tfp pilus assembly protein PilF